MSEWTSIVPSEDLFSLLQAIHTKLEVMDRRLDAMEVEVSQIAKSSRRATTADRRTFPALADTNHHIRTVNRAIRSKMVPPYMSTYRCCIQALANVQDLVDQGRQTIEAMGGSDTYVELEMRFGKHTPVNFHTGISETAFSHIERCFDSSSEFSRVTDWHNVWVYHHANTQRTATIRTETTFPPGSDETPGALPEAESVYKKTVDKRNYQTRLLMANDTDLQSADIRIALSVEQKPSADDIPIYVIPTSVHLKQRKTYLLCPNQYAEPVWQYTLTKRWFGTDRETTESNYKYQPPVYEVEIECVKPNYLCTQDSQYVAASILFKACDVLRMINSVLENRDAFVIEPQCLLWDRSKTCL